MGKKRNRGKKNSGAGNQKNAAPTTNAVPCTDPVAQTEKIESVSECQSHVLVVDHNDSSNDNCDKSSTSQIFAAKSVQTDKQSASNSFPKINGCDKCLHGINTGDAGNQTDAQVIDIFTILLIKLH